MRTINSPGVQITETDLSVVQQPIVGTQIFVTGFSSEGPTDQIINITGASELENTFGKPQTAAERYFYHTCKEILNSPGNLLVSRLPYGEGNGSGFATKQYSALLYPVVENSNVFNIGSPTHVNLNESEYYALKEGNFTWRNTFCSTTTASTITKVTSSITVPTDALSAFHILNVAAIDDDGTLNMSFPTPGFVTLTFQVNTPTIITVGNGACYAYDAMTDTATVSAGIIVLNDSQVTINQNFEGYYTVLTDNADIGADTDFTSVLAMYSLTGTNDFYSVPESRLNVALSASAGLSRESVSEAIERTQNYYFADTYYNDSLLFNVFKVYKSNNQPQVLTVQLIETYAGSLDKNKKELAITGGGTARSFFLEDVVNGRSPNMTLLVNPKISTDTQWTDLATGSSSKEVRTLTNAKALYPVGVFKPSYNTSNDKRLGDIPAKITRVLRLVESIENINMDVVVDAGLSTIHTNKDPVTDLYDDSVVANLATINVDINTKWRSIFSIFNNFVQSVRKDCIYVVDPLRQIFVNGYNTKLMSKKNSDFSSTVYSPLRESFATINSNYSTTYGNWVRVLDTFTDKFCWVPFSGYAAAIYARTDAVAYPWIAPAGLSRGIVNNINDIAFNPNQKQRDFLYTIGVNPLVFFTGEGYAVFGQKTLQTKPSAFDRINVRRLFLALEKAVLRVAKYFVFEPNTVTTRSRFVNTVSPIFDLAKNTEGLYDYLIVCDDRNNTTTTIDNNELIADIYIKPVRTAEFILINFIATRTSQNFQELI